MTIQDFVERIHKNTFHRLYCTKQRCEVDMCSEPAQFYTEWKAACESYICPDHLHEASQQAGQPACILP